MAQHRVIVQNNHLIINFNIFFYLSADTSSFLIKLVDDMLKNKSDITTLY